MNKKLSKLTLLLTTVMVATGCNDVSYKKDKETGKFIIYTINDGEKSVNYYADDLLLELQTGSSVKSTLYSEVSRQVFTAYGEKTVDTAVKDSLRSEAKDDVDDFKENAKTSAKSEGTDYDTYLEEKLEGEGVETLDELEDLYYYNGLKKEILEDYVEDNYEYFLDKYLTNYTPYQVKHVLVAANSADTNYVNGTMTAENARKLLNVLDRFTAGDTFATIADLTDDTSSKDNGGIMPFNEAQNYVSEFRFAPYAMTIFGNYTSASPAKTAATITKEDETYKTAVKLHVISDDADSADYVTPQEWADSDFYQSYQDGIGSVKLDDILELSEPVSSSDAGWYNYKNQDADGHYVDANGKVITVAEQKYEMNVTEFKEDGELNPKYFEEYKLRRNYIFNNTLNTHQVKYIEVDASNKGNANTKVVKTKAGDKTVLADENGNPIFFALASTGIHFMSMVWDSNAKTTKENHDYFKLLDSDDKYFDKPVAEGGYADTYIGQNTKLTRSELETNSDKLLSDVSSYVSNLEYYLFNALVYDAAGTGLESERTYTIKFYDNGYTNMKDTYTKLEDVISEYVKDQITSTDESFASSVQSSAETYGKKLAREAEQKSYIDNWYVTHSTTPVNYAETYKNEKTAYITALEAKKGGN